MNENKPVKHGALWTVLFAVVSLFWIFPIVLVLINSFKQKAYISKNAFSLPAGKAFVGLENYVRGIETTQFFASFGWTLLITVGSVVLILVCTSMCAWWIVRVNNWAAKLLYTLFLFNMIVPFQMVMFTLSKIADMLKLNTPWGLCIVYLGFGAGLAVFIFTGVIKGIPQELEESAMIDGASVPRIFFQIVVPIYEAVDRLGGHPRSHVDLERLPAAVPDARPRQVQDRLGRRAIPQGRLRFRGYGRHDGLPGAGHHPHHRLLLGMPEVYSLWCHGGRGQGLSPTIWLPSLRGSQKLYKE